MNYNGHGVCRAELRSVTLAQKAQRSLSAAAIPTEVVKLEGARGRGCSFGIEIPCNQCTNAERILSASGITVKLWNRVD